MDLVIYCTSPFHWRVTGHVCKHFSLQGFRDTMAKTFFSYSILICCLTDQQLIIYSDLLFYAHLQYSCRNGIRKRLTLEQSCDVFGCYSVLQRIYQTKCFFFSVTAGFQVLFVFSFILRLSCISSGDTAHTLCTHQLCSSVPVLQHCLVELHHF